MNSNPTHLKTKTNHPRTFWNAKIKNILPKTRLCRFFRELFLQNTLQFSWEFLESLYAIFIELNLSLKVLQEFDKVILNILDSNGFNCPPASQFRTICLNRASIRRKNYTKYFKRVQEFSPQPFYQSLFYFEEEVPSKKIKIEDEEFVKVPKKEYVNLLLLKICFPCQYLSHPFQIPNLF